MSPEAPSWALEGPSKNPDASKIAAIKTLGDRSKLTAKQSIVLQKKLQSDIKVAKAQMTYVRGSRSNSSDKLSSKDKVTYEKHKAAHREASLKLLAVLNPKLSAKEVVAYNVVLIKQNVSVVSLIDKEIKKARAKVSAK